MATTIYPIIINGSNLVPSTNNNTYQYFFPSSIQLEPSSKIALASINMFYSWYNISTAYNNNKFNIIWATNIGTTTYNLTIPDGYYTVAQLNTYLDSFLIQNGLYLIDNNGKYIYYLEIQENPNVYGIQLNSFPIPNLLPAGWSNPAAMTFPAIATTPQFVILNNNFQQWTGVNQGIYPSPSQATTYSKVSDFTPQVTPIQSVLMTCSLVNNAYANPTSLLYSFNTSNTAFGGLITSSPNEYIFVNVQQGLYSDITIRFSDQSFNPISIRDTNIVINLLVLSENKDF